MLQVAQSFVEEIRHEEKLGNVKSNQTDSVFHIVSSCGSSYKVHRSDRGKINWVAIKEKLQRELDFSPQILSKSDDVSDSEH